VNKKQSSKNIKQFTDELIALGENHGAEQISQYAKSVRSQYDSFDIGSLRITLKNFPDIKNKYRELSK